MLKHSQFGNLRTLVIDNEPWFVGKDVASALGYSKERNALDRHVDKDDALKRGITDSMGRTQQMTIINESGLYSLILSSKLPTAKQFKHWVTAEVLPAIRKTGGYIAGEKDMTDEELICKAWFVGKDVASALGYAKPENAIARHVNSDDKTLTPIQGGCSNTRDALQRHVADEDKIMGRGNTAPSVTDNLGRIQYPVWINESGLYSLILSSKLPTAKQFKHWVTAFLSLAYIPALCVHIQSRINSVYFSINFFTCQYKMDYRAKYEVNCCLSRIKSKKRLICCVICRSINCVVFKHNYYLSCFFCSKNVIKFNFKNIVYTICTI